MIEPPVGLKGLFCGTRTQAMSPEVLVMILGKSFVWLRGILYIQNGPMEFVTVLL